MNNNWLNLNINSKFIFSQKYRKVPGDKCTGGSVEISAPKLKTKNCDVVSLTSTNIL